jgi:transcriptional regulator with XRE-family HTH domain
MRKVELTVLGEACRHLRLEHELTTEQLAKKCGLHRTYISDVERGARNVTFLTLLRMARALSTTISDLTYNFEFVFLLRNEMGRPVANRAQRNGRRKKRP